MRVALAAALFAAPDLLLLDEPTNHLDLEATLWLEGFLASYPRTLLLVSHDRDLLNTVVDGILHLDAGRLAFYPDRKSDVSGQRVSVRVDLGTRRLLNTKQNYKT